MFVLLNVPLSLIYWRDHIFSVLTAQFGLNFHIGLFYALFQGLLVCATRLHFAYKSPQNIFLYLIQVFKLAFEFFYIRKLAYLSFRYIIYKLGDSARQI